MDTTLSLFTSRSILTMLHGIVLGGGALLGLSAALFYLRVMPGDASGETAGQARAFSVLLTLTAAALWAGVIAGTYIVFPPYRATPPEGLTDLTAYPRSLLLANPSTAWLHAFAMEIKEHVPWTAAMISTAVAFVSTRRAPALMRDPEVRRIANLLLWICIALVATAALLGTFANKVAPLE
jgi:hypothetical protein